MAITNLAQLKRAMQVGTKWRMIYHLNFLSRNPDGSVNYVDQDRGIRTVEKKQQGQIAFRIQGKPAIPGGQDELSWMNFGQASEWKFENDQATCYLVDSGNSETKPLPILTYIQIEE